MEFTTGSGPGPYTPQSPEWWLGYLTQKLMHRQQRYDVLEDWVTGNHPLPNGDDRYVKALKDLQKMARTNYITLVIQAVTERMRVKAFTFGSSDAQDAPNDPSVQGLGQPKPAQPTPSTTPADPMAQIQNTPPPSHAANIDEDAKKIWDASNGQLFGTVCINTAASFGDCYALVSPPDPDVPNAEPLITYEDPRQCIVEEDPVNPYKAVAGLKLYRDRISGEFVAMLYLPDVIYEYRSSPYNLFTQLVEIPSLTHLREFSGVSPGLYPVKTYANPLGEVPLIRGNWQPWHGPLGIAECENGAFDIQNRINFTMLSRLVITKSQAYRQRMMSGVTIPKPKKGKVPQRPPFQPGADMLWIAESPDAKLWDLDQADITQILEATRDDVGDLAAITQTPATYLMNRMANVSGDTLTQDQSALLSKIAFRKEAMGWFFERVMRVAFKYKNDPRAEEPDVQVLWHDPEIHRMAELADMVAKYAAAGIPMELVMEKAGFEPDQIAWASQQIAQQKAQELALQQQQAQQSHEQNLAAIKAGGDAKAAQQKAAGTKPAAK